MKNYLLKAAGAVFIAVMLVLLYLSSLYNYLLFHTLAEMFTICIALIIYRAIILNGIREPYELIFREMKQKEQMLFEQNMILKGQATVDGLTGVFNHRHLYERLEEEAKRHSRNRNSFTVMILDIDHFKNINDTFSHLTGDKILKDLAQIFREHIRQTDLVGRYGGEEFLIMLSGTSLREGFEVAEEIRRTVEKKEFTMGISLTVSIGISEYGGEKISELLEKVDAKLYAAKNSGRNRMVME